MRCERERGTAGNEREARRRGCVGLAALAIFFFFFFTLMWKAARGFTFGIVSALRHHTPIHKKTARSPTIRECTLGRVNAKRGFASIPPFSRTCSPFKAPQKQNASRTATHSHLSAFTASSISNAEGTIAPRLDMAGTQRRRIVFVLFSAPPSGGFF